LGRPTMTTWGTAIMGNQILAKRKLNRNLRVDSRLKSHSVLAGRRKTLPGGSRDGYYLPHQRLHFESPGIVGERPSATAIAVSASCEMLVRGASFLHIAAHQ